MADLKPTTMPFGVYDFLGYLLPGLFFLLILLFEYDMGRAISSYLDHQRSFDFVAKDAALYKLPYLMKLLSWEQTPKDFKFMPLLLLLIVCYLLGHAIAAISSIFIEKIVLSRTFRYPDNNLFRPLLTRQEQHKQVRLRRMATGVGFAAKWASLRLKKRKFMFGWRKGCRFFASRYCQDFDRPFITEFKKVVNKRFGFPVRINDYYWLCYSDVVHHLPNAYQRTQHFVNLYGFTRNVCMTFVLYITVRLSSIIVYAYFNIPYDLRAANKLILLTYGFFAIILFCSYLKLYRRQTIELFYAFFSLHTLTTLPVLSPAADADNV